MTQAMTRTYIIATHSFLVRVDFDATWQIQHFTVLDTEHHYGTTFHNGQLLTVKRNDNQIDAPVLNRYHSAEQRCTYQQRFDRRAYERCSPDRLC